MNEYKHAELTLQLRDAVLSGRYGERLPALRHLSIEYNVALRTVCKAVKPLIACGMIEPGPRGSIIRQPARTRNFRTIGVVPGGPEFESVLLPVAGAAGYQLLFLEKEMIYDDRDFLLKQAIDGVLFTYSSMQRDQLNALRQANIPFVAGAKWWGREKIVISDGDLASGYRQMVKRLRKLGHKRIGWFSSSRSPEYTGYLDYLHEVMEKETSGSFAPELFFTAPPHMEWLIDGDEEAYYRQMAELAVNYFNALRNPPTAVITGWNFAVGMIDIWRERGISVPQDISIGCIDSDCRPPETLSGFWYSATDRAVWGLARLLEMLRGELPLASQMNQQPVWRPGGTIGIAPEKPRFH